MMSRYNPTPVRAEYADRAERLAKKGQIGRAIRHATSKRPPGGSGPSELVREGRGNRIPRALVDAARRRQAKEELRDALPTVPTVEMKKERWVGAKDKANLIGRSYTYVKDHARELGGRKNRLGRWEFPA